LHKLETDAEYAFLHEAEAVAIPQIQSILAKKAEGRPVTPEEYQVLLQFVDRVERGVLRKRQAVKLEENEQYQAIRSKIPEQAFSIYLEDLPLSVRTFSALSEAGYDSLGGLMLQIELDSDAILRLGGIGPKALEEIKTVIATMQFEGTVVEPEGEAEAASVIESEVEPKEAAVPETSDAIVLEPAEIPEAVEGVAEGLPVEEGAALVEVAVEPSTVETEAEENLDQLFKVSSEMLISRELDEDEDDEDSSKKDKKGKKKKRKHIEMEYDPDRDIMIVKHPRKRGEGDWDDDWKI
jgi:N utilization substance protein A